VHSGDTVNERLLAAMSQKAPSIASVMPQLPRAIVLAVDKSLEFQMADRFEDARAMQWALRKAYETVEKRPLPGSLNPPPPDFGASQPEGLTDSNISGDVAVSVLYDPGSSVDSIVVDIEDPTGIQERYEVKVKTSPAGEQGAGRRDEATTELSSLPDVTIQELGRAAPPPKPRKA
jgi:hypothetical protein